MLLAMDALDLSCLFQDDEDEQQRSLAALVVRDFLLHCCHPGRDDEHELSATATAAAVQVPLAAAASVVQVPLSAF